MVTWMADVNEVASRLLDEKNWEALTGVDAVPAFAMDAVVLLKSQQAEIERLEKENGTLKLAIQSMPNWLDEKRPEVVRCKDCRFRDDAVARASVTQRMQCEECRPYDEWYCAYGERK